MRAIGCILEYASGLRIVNQNAYAFSKTITSLKAHCSVTAIMQNQMDLPALFTCM